MLLQPDSQLYIVPSGGGEARRLRCNTECMNSWHTWSPNGKWLAFSSKANGPYTQLFLTHVDERGCSTPPVLLDRFTSRDRAANIPEFVNTAPDAIAAIREKFLDEYSLLRSAAQLDMAGEPEAGEAACRKALDMNPDNADAHHALAFLLYKRGRVDEAIAHLRKAIVLNPKDGRAHYNLAAILAERGQYAETVELCRKALAIEPELREAQSAD